MIQLDKVQRAFQVGDQQVRALRDVSLTIAAGEYVSIMGPSGSGKSTLLNVLGLLDHPDGGSYRLEGRETVTMDDQDRALLRRQYIGFVFQFFHLVPRLTAAENVELPLMLAGAAPRERRATVDRILRDYGLADRAHHRPDQLSGGQRQRVAIARAIVMRPSLLLADEPTGNLDRATGLEVISLLESLNRDDGITLVMVTHDPELGNRARRHLRMEDGALIGDTARP